MEGLERGTADRYTWSDSRPYKKILEAFGNWMFVQGYTRTRVEINQQDRS